MAFEYTLTGGAIWIDPNYSNSNGITSRQAQQMPPGMVNMLFAVVCLVTGLDTPQLRAKFRSEFEQLLRSNATGEYVYEQLIERAYNVKYADSGT